jgi:hypothetical protein
LEVVNIILIGFAAVTIFDILGSLLSRILNFEYVWLAFGSFVIYGIIAVYLESYTNLSMAMIGTFILGVYDSTVGLLIPKMLKANIKQEDLEAVQIRFSLAFRMGILASVIGIISIWLFS